MSLWDLQKRIGSALPVWTLAVPIVVLLILLVWTWWSVEGKQ